MLRAAPRHELESAIARVAALVGVGTSGQDWDVEHADAGRIEAFCDAYEREALTVAERFALMRLMIASCDDSLRAGARPPALARIEALLTRDYAIHFHTVRYWACLDSELADGFAVTPSMRAVYAACTPAVVLAALADDPAGVEAALAAKPGQEQLDDALLGAAAHARTAIVRRLLAAGASVAAREEGGQTALMCAVGGAPGTLAVLLAAGCEVDATDSLGWTALHRAAMNGEFSAVCGLLAAGADVTVRDDDGYDALMMAAEHGSLATLERLLEHGARVGATNRRGEDALAIARRHAGYPSPGAESRQILERLRFADSR